MDKAMLLVHLAQAERHIAAGEANISRQRKIVTTMEAGGHSELLPTARQLLNAFEEAQAIHIASRYRLMGELARLNVSWA